MAKRGAEFSTIPGILENKLQNVGKTLFEGEAEERLVTQIEQAIGQLTHPTIYIHIPFCRTKCDFCDFPTVIFNSIIGTSYIAALDRQLAYLQKTYPQLDMSKVYIGGGTPATLLPELLTLQKKYNIGISELSVEAHPQDFAHITDEELREMGETFSRVSIGVQTFNEDLLEKMNRSNGKKPLEYINKAVESGMLVNVDLIYGIEGQTLESFLSDLNALIELGVPQITCYPLMGKETQAEPLAKEDQFYRALLDVFAQHGYRPLTPWCFTNSDQDGQGEYISQNDNDSREQILALGVGGISKLGNIFAINHFNLGEYFQAAAHDQLPIMSTKKLSAFQEAQYFLLTALFGMSIDTQRLTGNFAVDQLIKAELMALHAIGVIRRSSEEQTVYELTEQGMFYMSKAMSSFYAGLGHFRRPHNETILEDNPREGAEVFAMLGNVAFAPS